MGWASVYQRNLLQRIYQIKESHDISQCFRSLGIRRWWIKITWITFREIFIAEKFSRFTKPLEIIAVNANTSNQVRKVVRLLGVFTQINQLSFQEFLGCLLQKQNCIE